MNSVNSVKRQALVNSIGCAVRRLIAVPGFNDVDSTTIEVALITIRKGTGITNSDLADLRDVLRMLMECLKKHSGQEKGNN